ncbi:hypothetical protein [Spartinivicinus ruber]|uniref:hypothetical protein n=1 Tax=Spartinivicinus ruber TaxID=2683272 RepID=UPI0013D36D50|nr:hypothetical protein [Spartinivicinus ruber]
MDQTYTIAAQTLIKRVKQSYTVEHFHLRQAAEDCLHGLQFMITLADTAISNNNKATFLANISHLLQGWIKSLYPIMPSLMQKLSSNLSKNTHSVNYFMEVFDAHLFTIKN